MRGGIWPFKPKITVNVRVGKGLYEDHKHKLQVGNFLIANYAGSHDSGDANEGDSDVFLPYEKGKDAIQIGTMWSETLKPTPVRDSFKIIGIYDDTDTNYKILKTIHIES
jgi:hypothetical protein